MTFTLIANDSCPYMYPATPIDETLTLKASGSELLVPTVPYHNSSMHHTSCPLTWPKAQN